MSSSSFHIKKSSKICTNNIDDLSLVKSTTLANWYEEFEVLSRNYKKTQESSSRYKLQVIKEVQELTSSPNVFIPIVQLNSNNNNNISLFDKYEIDRISSQLEKYIENSSKEKIIKNNHDKKFKIFKGFLLFRYYKMMKMNMCVTSSYDDVVVVEKSVYNNSRLPEKSPVSAPVVKFDTCRPWSKHV
ncbi:hypothetical protein AABB24_037895 [Solanum stoloniferum]|uniref:Uncharacterized protein n=1 Tax=Solanum stoloniferum TaxID=62892 RepID=A0ABD2QVB6_9SOLN